MTIIVFAIVNYTTLTRYDLTYENPVDHITPEFVKRMVRDGKLRGKAFIILAGSRLCYAVKDNKQFYVKYLT